MLRHRLMCTTGLSKAVVCIVLSMEKCLSKRVAYVAAAGFQRDHMNDVQ